jgi:hypothetical protein
MTMNESTSGKADRCEDTLEYYNNGVQYRHSILIQFEAQATTVSS